MFFSRFDFLFFQSQYRIFFPLLFRSLWSLCVFYSNAFIVLSSGFVFILMFYCHFRYVDASIWAISSSLCVCVSFHTLFEHKTGIKTMKHNLHFHWKSTPFAQEDNRFVQFLLVSGLLMWLSLARSLSVVALKCEFMRPFYTHSVTYGVHVSLFVYFFFYVSSKIHLATVYSGFKIIYLLFKKS